MQHPKDGYVFVVTYGRSGSTVIQTMLQSIDGYFIRGENNNVLMALYDAYDRAKFAKEVQGGRNHTPERPWYGAFNISPKRFGRKLARMFVNEIIQPPEGARVVGFKEIRFHQVGTQRFEDFLNFIAEYFPGTKFVFNTRDWADVARSSWWAQMPEARVREIVETCDALYTAYAAKYPKHSHMMKYEHYKGNPEAFKPLFKFLGEHYDADRVAKVLANELDHCK